VLGTVDDVRPYLARATVVVVPLRFASGTRLKILQALAMEKAVVSTAVGAEGLHLDPSDIVQADTPRAFATAVIRLLVDSSKRQQLGEAGRRAVVARYDWNVAAARLYGLYTTLARQGTS
jgi:glycosyltransferase involved in cell wall biosynthesis